MKINEVIRKALADPIYAAELAAKAGRASASVDAKFAVEGDAWHDLLQEFASTPEELARLVSDLKTTDNPTLRVPTTTITTITITTTTTIPCGITTTTTTTGTLTTTTLTV